MPALGLRWGLGRATATTISAEHKPAARAVPEDEPTGVRRNPRRGARSEQQLTLAQMTEFSLKLKEAAKDVATRRLKGRLDAARKTTVSFQRDPTPSAILRPAKYLARLPGYVASFLFKLRSGTLPVGKEMVKRGRWDSDRCPACGSEGEDLVHFLLHCAHLSTDRSLLARGVMNANLDDLRLEQLVADIDDDKCGEGSNCVPRRITILHDMWRKRCDQLTSSQHSGESSNLSACAQEPMDSSVYGDEN